jgi:hypothetical protein
MRIFTSVLVLAAAVGLTACGQDRQPEVSEGSYRAPYREVQSDPCYVNGMYICEEPDQGVPRVAAHVPVITLPPAPSVPPLRERFDSLRLETLRITVLDPSDTTRIAMRFRPSASYRPQDIPKWTGSGSAPLEWDMFGWTDAGENACQLHTWADSLNLSEASRIWGRHCADFLMYWGQAYSESGADISRPDSAFAIYTAIGMPARAREAALKRASQMVYTFTEENYYRSSYPGRDVGNEYYLNEATAWWRKAGLNQAAVCQRRQETITKVLEYVRGIDYLRREKMISLQALEQRPCPTS